MYYELWDVRSGNLINTYDTERDALVVVGGLPDAHGPEHARSLSPAFENDDGHTPLVTKCVVLATRDCK